MISFSKPIDSASIHDESHPDQVAGHRNQAVVLGVDPGIASLGLARIAMTKGGEFKAEAVRCIKTSKASKKELRALRVSADDVRRASNLWDAMIAMADGIQALAYEVYQPFKGKAANGGKVTTVCGMAMALGFSLKIPVYAVLPADIKQETLGRNSGSKGDVREALYKRVPGFRACCEGIPRGQLEHVSDATAVALIGLKMLAGY